MKKNTRFRLQELVFVILLLVSGFMLGFSSGGFVVNINAVGFTVLSTMQEGVHKVFSSIAGTFTAIRDIAELQEEYRLLSEKLENYEYMKRNNAEINKENERLREQLAFAETTEYKNIAARIIGRNPDNLYSGITIDKGIRSGIKKGMPVVAVQNGNVGIVGKVVTVGVSTSLIMPLYDVQCNISARVQNTRDLGIVSGNGSEESPLSLRYIRKRVRDELRYGDVIVTSGENDNYMRDIPIGTIEKVSVLDYDTSLDIELKPIIDFSRLEIVFVVNQNLANDRIPSEQGGAR